MRGDIETVFDVHRLLAELADRGAPVVFCASNHAPRSVLMPLDGHHAQGARMRAQWQAKTPQIKQAWKQVVIAKIRMQAAALEAHGHAHAPLEMMVRKVTSGDNPIQIENPKFTLLIAGSVTRFFESCKSGQIFICPGSRMRPISSTNMRLIFDFTSVLAPI